MKKYYNPETKKQHEDLFEELCPVFTVCCRTPNIVDGYKGAAVYLNVEACNEEEAKNKALKNKAFTEHLHMKTFNKDRHLDVYRPNGLYVIGRVEYFEGDPRL